jgi:cobalamin biosynthesis protein CobD/CbiB
LAEYQLGEISMANESNKLGPKDFITGCLVIVVAVFVVPILVLLFKVSVYLAVIIGVIVAVVLGIALLGKVVRLIFFGSGSDDKQKNNYIE